jgi:hypothetical protein
MSELLKFILMGSLPLGAMLLLLVVHLARGTTYVLDRQIWVTYLIVQALVAGLIYWSLQVHAFGEAVSGTVGGGTDTLGSTTSTRLFIHLDGGDSKEFHFAEQVPAACTRGATIKKPAHSTVWTCSTRATTLEHDANPPGFFLVAAGVGAAFLLFLGRR